MHLEVTFRSSFTWTWIAGKICFSAIIVCFRLLERSMVEISALIRGAWLRRKTMQVCFRYWCLLSIQKCKSIKYSTRNRDFLSRLKTTLGNYVKTARLLNFFFTLCFRWLFNVLTSWAYTRRWLVLLIFCKLFEFLVQMDPSTRTIPPDLLFSRQFIYLSFSGGNHPAASMD